MRWRYALVANLLLAAALAAAPADSSPFTFPTAPKVDPPVPQPGGVLKLTGDTLYVVSSKVDATVRAHPAGLVKVSKKKGPRDITARFIDGTGAVEDRTYDGPFVFVVTAVGTGRVELDLIPFGLKSDAEIETRTIDVNAGMGPQPPPKPGPDPKPPDPKPPDPIPAPDAILVASFKAALAKDIAAGVGTKAKAADLAIVFDSGATLLDLNDPAIAPKTVGELYTKMVLASVAKGVPRPPYLKETRMVIDANLPLLNGLTELTPALKAEFQTRYRAVAVALTEASK